MVAEIDNIDFGILNCVKAAGKPLWKKEVHRRISSDQYALPIDTSISAQTTGRHIDALEEEGFLESTVTSSEDVNRHLIIGFQVTESGEHILDAKRETLLKKIVSRELFEDNIFPIETNALEQLICEEYTAGLAGNVTDDYSREQLVLLLGMYFIEHKAIDAFSEEERQQLHSTIQDASSDF